MSDTILALGRRLASLSELPPTSNRPEEFLTNMPLGRITLIPLCTSYQGPGQPPGCYSVWHDAWVQARADVQVSLAQLYSHGTDSSDDDV
jgi:hypothetical protein